MLTTKTPSKDNIDDKAAAMINEVKVSSSAFTHYASKATRLPDVEELADEDNAIDFENQCTRYTFRHINSIIKLYLIEFFKFSAFVILHRWHLTLHKCITFTLVTRNIHKQKEIQNKLI